MNTITYNSKYRDITLTQSKRKKISKKKYFHIIKNFFFQQVQYQILRFSTFKVN